MELSALKYLAENAGNGIVLALSMVHVYEGNTGRRAQVGNGRYVVDVPCDLPVCTVSAERLVAAWNACKGEPKTEVGASHLTVKSGRVRARIQLFKPEDYPRVEPTPRTAQASPGVAALLSRLAPYVATDASKPWATAVCLKDGHAYATNNVILCRAPFPSPLPGTVMVPGSVFDAVIARGEPVGLGADDNAMTFYFEDGSWIKTQLVNDQWPTHVVDGIVNALDPASWETPHPDLALMLATAAKVADARHPIVEFTGNGLKLTDDTFDADELDPVPEGARVNAKMATLVFERATGVQWNSPRKDVHAFRVDDIVGAFGGMR